MAKGQSGGIQDFLANNKKKEAAIGLDKGTRELGLGPLGGGKTPLISDAEPKKKEAPELFKRVSAKTKEKLSLKNAPKGQPNLLKKAFGAKGKDIQNKAESLVKDVAKEEGKKSDSFFDKDTLQSAALGLIPILVGGLLGGADGALAGLGAAGEGFKAKAEAEQEQEVMDLKSRELDIKAKEAEGRAGLVEAQTDLAKGKVKKLSMEEGVKLDPDKLRKEYNSESKSIGTKNVAVAFERIKSSAKDPSAAGDLAMIFNYMKMLDPGSTVREGEFANAQNSGGVPDKIRARYNNVISGQRLSNDMRNDFLNRSGSLYQAQLKTQSEIDKRYSDIAIKTGKDPSLVLDPSFSAAVQTDTGAPVESKRDKLLRLRQKYK